MTKCKICGEDAFAIARHVRDYHNLDPMDYWVQYYSEDKQKPVCKYCGTEIKHFKSGSLICGPGVYCNKDCMNADLPRVLSERHANGIYENSMYLINTWNTDTKLRYESLARTEKSRILRNVDRYSKAYLYVIEYEGRIKLGASTHRSLEDYIWTRYGGVNLTSYLAFEGLVWQVAQIEYLLKLKFKDKSYLMLGLEHIASSMEEFSKDIKVDLLNSISKYTCLSPYKFEW